MYDMFKYTWVDMECDLTNKVIAITDARSGIGPATVVACARAGMDVSLQARRAERLLKVATQVKKAGRMVLIVAGDVDQFIDATISRFGRLDAVFVNAGFRLCGSAADTTDEQARAIFETNFFGTMRLIQATLPVMRQQGSGHILICSSAVSEIGLLMNGLYCTTKADQDSIASSMRAGAVDEGIHVSSIHPVGTRTEFYEAASIRSGRADRSFNTPLILVQSPPKVARAIVRCLRRPRPEVWPQLMSRFGLAVVKAFHIFNTTLMRKRYSNIKPRYAVS